MNTLEYKLSYMRHLPHIQPLGATLFVTFRLAGTIPADVIEQLLHETMLVEERINQIENTRERARQMYREQKRLFGQWDNVLDKAETGPRWLTEPAAAAEIMMEAFHYRDGNVYDLDTFSIMCNHAHVLFTPLEESDGNYYALSKIMQSLKGNTARKINDLVGRMGQFWQHESYDHFVRDEAELQRIRRYILLNPLHAGLVQQWDEWPWLYTKYPL